MPLTSNSPSHRFPQPIASAMDRFLGIDRLETLYERAAGGPADIFTQLLQELEVRVDVDPQDLARIPRTGAAVAVCNHPFGILDGIVLGRILTGVRPDVRILTNRFLSGLPLLHPWCIFVDVLGDAADRKVNRTALRAALEHLRAGGLLAIFPAGEVSHFDVRAGAVRDPAWHPLAARLIRMSGAKAAPIFVRGSNGVPFQILGMLHPRLRTAALPAELLNKRGRSVEVRVGAPIDAAALGRMPDSAATRYLRLRSELLGRRGTPPRTETAQVKPIADPMEPSSLRREIETLPPEALMLRSGSMSVFVAPGPAIPNIVLEIGRLREITFRKAGEGTGRARDLDWHDDHYLHLFLWNRETSEITGAYRIGDVPKLLAEFGPKGLYTTSLFHFAPGFLRRLQPALELGRSFVCPQYQRQFAPLLLLWKGISAYVASRPQYAILIGAVTVSNDYSGASREMIARYFESRRASIGEKAAVRPRRRLPNAALARWEVSALCSLLSDADELSGPIADLERDGKGLPILLRQYAKLGGEMLAFSVDRRFNNALDGFVMVDLTRTNPRALVRYMGEDAMRQFLAFQARLRNTAA